MIRPCVRSGPSRAKASFQACGWAPAVAGSSFPEHVEVARHDRLVDINEERFRPGTATSEPTGPMNRRCLSRPRPRHELSLYPRRLPAMSADRGATWSIVVAMPLALEASFGARLPWMCVDVRATQRGARMGR